MTIKRKQIDQVNIEADDSVVYCSNTTIQQQPACPLEEQLPDQGID